MKKSKNKDRIVNVKPCHAELVKSTENGFELWLYSNIGNDYSLRYIYKIHFERYWLSFFAQYTIVSTENRFGVTHTEHYAECTDKKGNFWKTDIEVIFPVHIDYEKSKELYDPIWSAHYT